MASPPSTRILWILPLLFPNVFSHMQMSKPCPLRSPLCASGGGPVDYNYLAPLRSDGSDFSCKGYQYNTPLVSVETYQAGETYTMALSGGATHGGGSCQLALSYDNGATFKVIKSMVGGCPIQKEWDFTVPSDAPSGNALFSWSWFNKIGNREMYQNCAVVTIVNPKDGKASGSVNRVSANQRIQGWADLYVANLNGVNKCRTQETQDVVFPDPGEDVVYGDDTSAADLVKRASEQCSGVGRQVATSDSGSASPSSSTDSAANDGQWQQNGSQQKFDDGQWHPDGQKAVSGDSTDASAETSVEVSASTSSEEDGTESKRPQGFPHPHHYDDDDKYYRISLKTRDGSEDESAPTAVSVSEEGADAVDASPDVSTTDQQQTNDNSTAASNGSTNVTSSDFDDQVTEQNVEDSNGANDVAGDSSAATGGTDGVASAPGDVYESDAEASGSSNSGDQDSSTPDGVTDVVEDSISPNPDVNDEGSFNRLLHPGMSPGCPADEPPVTIYVRPPASWYEAHPPLTDFDGSDRGDDMPSTDCPSPVWNCRGCKFPDRCVKVNACTRTCGHRPHKPTPFPPYPYDPDNEGYPTNCGEECEEENHHKPHPWSTKHPWHSKHTWKPLPPITVTITTEWCRHCTRTRHPWSTSSTTSPCTTSTSTSSTSSCSTAAPTSTSTSCTTSSSTSQTVEPTSVGPSCPTSPIPYATGNPNTPGWLPCHPGTFLCKSPTQFYTCGQFNNYGWTYGALQDVAVGMKCQPNLVSGVAKRSLRWLPRAGGTVGEEGAVVPAENGVDGAGTAVERTHEKVPYGFDLPVSPGDSSKPEGDPKWKPVDKPGSDSDSDADADADCEVCDSDSDSDDGSDKKNSLGKLVGALKGWLPKNGLPFPMGPGPVITEHIEPEPGKKDDDKDDGDDDEREDGTLVKRQDADDWNRYCPPVPPGYYRDDQYVRAA